MNYGMDYQGGGDTGGGYTTNNYEGGGNTESSQTVRRSYDEQTLLPVTAKMILGAQPDPSGGGDGSLILEDGRRLSTVKLIGAVRSHNPQTTNVMYELEDGTGLIEVKQWLDDNDSQAMQELREACMKDHIYIKVIGQIKDYEGNKMLLANSVRPLSSANELTHHMLSVVYTAEQAKRKNSIVPPAPVSSGVGFGSGGSNFGAAPIAQNNTGGDSLKDKVLKLIQTSDDGGESGVNIQNCFGMMPSHSEAEIREAVEMLSADGHIYSTIDEDHYKHAG